MVATISQIIGKINPKLYADNSIDLLKKYGSSDKIPAEEVKPKSINYSMTDGRFKLESKGIEAAHSLRYDSSSETLEPVYFFILDLMEARGLKPEKLIDNFTSSPGSGHFAELGQRATIMQQQGSKILGDVNTVLRSVLNIVYDLKEFRIRLEQYDNLSFKDPDVKDAALMSMKQIWLDKVDITKGNSSIKAMALGQAGFQTLLDAFLISKDEKDADKLDLNERVKRIVKQRVQEFNIWLSQSEIELRKRYQLERTYLKSQVNSLKLYSRWAKPYLKAAQQLEQKDQGRNPNLVNTFNTIILELTILGKSKLDIEASAYSGDIPKDFRSMKPKRDYYSCILVDFTFRGIPQRVSQQAHYAFGGKVDVVFRGYALNDDELKALDRELDKSDLGDVLKLIEDTTTESMDVLQEEITFFLEDKTKEEKEREKNKDDSNPFLALIGRYDKSDSGSGKKDDKKSGKDSKKSKDEDKPVKTDDWIEKNHFRRVASANAAEVAFSLFDIYKKAHSMPSYT